MVAGCSLLQQPDANRRIGIVQADGQEAPVIVEDDGKIARPALRAHGPDRVVENPGMALAKGALRGGRDADGQTFLAGLR